VDQDGGGRPQGRRQRVPDDCPRVVVGGRVEGLAEGWVVGVVAVSASWLPVGVAALRGTRGGEDVVVDGTEGGAVKVAKILGCPLIDSGLFLPPAGPARIRR